jgi:hypothetical protein
MDSAGVLDIARVSARHIALSVQRTSRLSAPALALPPLVSDYNNKLSFNPVMFSNVAHGQECRWPSLPR